MADMVRKHYVLPREVAEEFERLAGHRQQSERLTEILERWLKSQRLLSVIEQYAGFVSAADHPEWATSADINNWVRELRATGWERSQAYSLREDAEVE